MAVIDDDANDGLAVTVRRQGVELTWATVRAIAMRKIFPLDHPFDLRHGSLR
jgi:hypothetical protein